MARQERWLKETRRPVCPFRVYVSGMGGLFRLFVIYGGTTTRRFDLESDLTGNNDFFCAVASAESDGREQRMDSSRWMGPDLKANLATVLSVVRWQYRIEPS